MVIFKQSVGLSFSYQNGEKERFPQVCRIGPLVVFPPFAFPINSGLTLCVCSSTHSRRIRKPKPACSISSRGSATEIQKFQLCLQSINFSASFPKPKVNRLQISISQNDY